MLVAEIIGNLGGDAEIKTFSDKKYVSFSVAHTDYGRDPQGNRTEQTTWVSVLWYGDGGGLFQYLKRGVKVFVRGRQNVKQYTDKNGVSRVAINVNATEIQLCGSRADSESVQSEKATVQQAPQEQKQSAPTATEAYTNDLPF